MFALSSWFAGLCRLNIQLWFGMPWTYIARLIEQWFPLPCRMSTCEGLFWLCTIASIGNLSRLPSPQFSCSGYHFDLRVQCSAFLQRQFFAQHQHNNALALYCSIILVEWDTTNLWVTCHVSCCLQGSAKNFSLNLSSALARRTPGLHDHAIDDLQNQKNRDNTIWLNCGWHSKIECYKAVNESVKQRKHIHACAAKHTHHRTT